MHLQRLLGSVRVVASNGHPYREGRREGSTEADQRQYSTFWFGAGTSARVALLHARGELALNEWRRFEGPLGTFFVGTPVASEGSGEITYVRPKVTCRAYLTGSHQFGLNADDPLPRGSRIGRKPQDIPAQTA